MNRKRFVAWISLIELLAAIVINILVTLYPSVADCDDNIVKTKEAKARFLINNISIALSSYHNDNGIYPPGDGTNSKDLVLYLRTVGPRKLPYCVFKDEEIDSNGNLKSPIIEGDYFKYRENETKKQKTAEMHKKYTFDIWLKDSKGNVDGINNWE